MLSQALDVHDRVSRIDQLVHELNAMARPRLGGDASSGGRLTDVDFAPGARGRMLVVLDNAEDLLQAGSEQLSKLLTPLLDGCPHVSFLVTSTRAVGQDLVDVSERELALGALTPREAATLFLKRAPVSITVKDVLDSVARLDVDPHWSYSGTRPQVRQFRESMLGRLRALAKDIHAGTVHRATLLQPATVEMLSVLPLMEYLSGHPQAISVKSRTLKYKSLADLAAPERPSSPRHDDRECVAGGRHGYTRLRLRRL